MNIFVPSGCWNQPTKIEKWYLHKPSNTLRVFSLDSFAFYLKIDHLGFLISCFVTYGTSWWLKGAFSVLKGSHLYSAAYSGTELILKLMCNVMCFSPQISVQSSPSLETGNAKCVKQPRGICPDCSAPLVAAGSEITGASPLPSSSSLHPHLPKKWITESQNDCGWKGP